MLFVTYPAPPKSTTYYLTLSRHDARPIFRANMAIDHARLFAARCGLLPAGQPAVPRVASRAGNAAADARRRIGQWTWYAVAVHPVFAVACHVPATTEGAASSPLWRFSSRSVAGRPQWRLEIDP